MKNLILIAILLGVLFAYKGGMFTTIPGAYDADENPQVWLFTFRGCGEPCKDVVKALDRRVQYQHFSIDDEIGKERLVDAGGGGRFPLTFIGDKRVLGNDEMQLVSALAEVMGSDAVTSREERVLRTHFNYDDTPAIVMYGTSWCGACKKMRNYFEENNIKYKELDAEHEAEDEFRILKGGGYPLIYIGYRRIIGDNISLVEATMDELNI